MKKTIALCLLALYQCLGTAMAAESERSIARLYVYNHQAETGIVTLQIGEIGEAILGSYVGIGGGNPPLYLAADKSGEDVRCCGAYLRTWRPGLSTEVKWVSYDYASGARTERKATVTVPDYSADPGGEWQKHLHLHFFPGGKVKLFVTSRDIGDADYPLPKKERAPWPKTDDSAR
jgi:hypothetical protein